MIIDKAMLNDLSDIKFLNFNYLIKNDLYFIKQLIIFSKFR